jgi:capsule polysaccharide export protein KpsE/RkpR
VSDTLRATSRVRPESPPARRRATAGELPGRLWRQFRETWRQILGRFSFWTVVALSICLSTIYYFAFAESLYDSQTILSIQNKQSSSTSLLGGILGTSAGGSQIEQLYQYVISPDMLALLERKFHLRKLYSSPERNPFWRLWWPSSDESFLSFYRNMVDVQPDTTNGMITIDVLGYDAHQAQAMASEILLQSQRFINGQSALMQGQTMKFARNELENAVKAVAAAKLPYEREVAELRLSAAQSGLATATGAANAQTIFVIPISKPNFPTYTTRPERLLDIAGIALMVAIGYAVSFLMLANVRDHRKT